MAAAASTQPRSVLDDMYADAFGRQVDIISTFFTARYYNEIYNAARNFFAQRGGKSITDVYANTLVEYLRSIEKPDGQGVKPTIHALHDYAQKYWGKSTLNEFIDRIISHIAPAEYFDTIGATERDAILRGLISQVAITMGKRALQPDMLHKIIDERSDQIGISILRKVGTNVLRDFRASFLSKLFSDKVATPAGVVSSELYSKLRDELRGVLQELVTTQVNEVRATSERDEARRVLSATQARMRALEAIALKHRECEASLAQLQREVERARGQIADLSAVNTRLLKMDPQPALQEREPEREQPTRMKSAPRQQAQVDQPRAMIVPAVPLREHVAQSEAQDGAEVQVNASAPSVSQLSSAEAQESAGAPAEAQDDDGSDTASGSEDEALDLEEHARRIIDGRRRD